ncbi:MAG: YibE/F family protein [Spirochaetales bacterium]|nr:YibE/F family protein [Spirochaetales bacterium]
MISIHKKKLKDIVFVLLLALLLVILLLWPSPYENKRLIVSSERVKSLVLEADNTNVKSFGVVMQGDQELKIRVLEGRYKGKEFDAGNTIIGKLELDKLFRSGDIVFTVLDIDPETGGVLYANVLDYYRLDVEIILIVLFALLLVLFAGWTGFKSLVSFIFAVVMIWKVMVPLILSGINPIFVSLGITMILSAVIIFLVGGFTRKGIVAFIGALSGVVITSLLAIVFGHLFRVNGAVKPFSETILHSGYTYLDLNQILIAGVFLASSGAVMDLAMDVAASMQEVYDKHPSITRREHIRSGINVSRAVIGTMTTTLLLAYSGGYVSLLMVFIAQGIPLVNIFNISYVSTEILHTLVGSFGLVLVAPLTSIIGGFLIPGKRIPVTCRPGILFESGNIPLNEPVEVLSQ